MLNRKHTEAMQRLAKAKTRLAAAEEKFYPALLDAILSDDAPPSAGHEPTANSNSTPQKQPPKK